jgi:hypothetical protein
MTKCRCNPAPEILSIVSCPMREPVRVVLPKFGDTLRRDVDNDVVSCRELGGTAGRRYLQQLYL